MKLEHQVTDFVIKRAQRFGYVTRAQVVQTVGVSPVYASKIMALPENTTAKGLVRKGHGFVTSRPPRAAEFFDDLEHAARLPLPQRELAMGGQVPIWVSEGVRDNAPDGVVAPLCQAIEQHQSVVMDYVGMGFGEKRQIRRGEPIGFAHIQGRWHLRAWLYPSATGKKEGWRDLVLGRILDVRTPEKTKGNAPLRGWMNRLRDAEALFEKDGGVALDRWLLDAELMPETRQVSPHPDLTEDQKTVVRVEFGLGPIGEKTLLVHEWAYFERQYIALNEQQKPPQHLLVYREKS